VFDVAVGEILNVKARFYPKASSNSTQGRLDTHALTLGSSRILWMAESRVIGLPSNSSSPSMKKHTLNSLAVSSFTVLSKNNESHSSAQLLRSRELRRQAEFHSAGAIRGMMSGLS